MSRRRTAEQLDEVERRLDELSHQLERQLDSISNQLELVKTMFTIKDPSAGSSADAYEGLRRTVVLAREEKMARLVDLARVDAAASTRELTSDLRVLLDELLSAAGMQRIESLDDLELFDVFGSPADHQALAPRLVAPAYVHVETGAVVRLGRCEFVDTSGNDPDPESEVTGDGAHGEDPPEAEDTEQTVGPAADSAPGSDSASTTSDDDPNAGHPDAAGTGDKENGQ